MTQVAPTPITHRLSGVGPPVVLLNGGMMTFPSWEPFAARLRPRHQVLAFDFRGQLLTPGPGPGSLAGYAAEVGELLDHVGWPKAHLIGASFGAEVAVEFAATRPERTLSLIAITAMDRETPEFHRGSEEMRQEVARVLGGGARGRFHDLLVESVYSERYRRDQAVLMTQRREQIDTLPAGWFEGVGRLLAALEGFDLAPRLAAVRCPALAVLAADDRVMDAERARALAAAIGAPVVVHPTSGHALVAEDPDWLAEVCLGFLDSLPLPGSA